MMVCPHGNDPVRCGKCFAETFSQRSQDVPKPKKKRRKKS
jgi:hypothetical protein